MIRPVPGLVTLLFAGLVAVGSAVATSEPKPPGSITFVARNAVATANGTFHEWRVTRSRIDLSDLASSFAEIEIDVASLDTDIGRRDDHLRGEDFFQIERWPNAIARIHGVTADGEDERGRPRYNALFELRIRDVTKTVPGSFILLGDRPVKVEGELTLDRNDWGVGTPKRRFNPISISNDVLVRFRAALPPAQ